MSDTSSDRDPVERLAEEFASRLRNGEQPSLAEYTERYPDLAEQILELFPVLLAMENLKPAPAELTGPYSASAGERKLERLGDYRILREIGRGGMGVVYEAEQLSLGRRVALKVLPAHALSGEQQLERFRREARAAAKLHHTNIVPVFGVGEADGVHFYAMQFIPGQPLDQVLAELRRFRQQPPLSPSGDLSVAARSLLSGQPAEPEPSADRPPSNPGLIAPSGTSTGGGAYWRAVARLGVQAGQGLAYAHAHGVIHRDVKPSNLLLDPQGVLWITDFGLAKGGDDDNLTAAGDIVGTLRYMAPERFEGRCDLRADVYALGLTLYELITFRPAFGEGNREKLIVQITREEPDRPSKVNPEVPRDLETIILKAIARDPDMRYQTASALADDLQRFVEDRPILARRASSLERLARWSRRNPAVASLVGGIVVLTLALLVVAVGAAIYLSGVNSSLTAALGRESDALAKESDARQKESQALQKATEEGKRAAAAADQAQQRLGRLYLENGVRSDDPSTRLLWFAEALKYDHDNSERAEAHRLRVLSHLRGASGPEHVFPITSFGAGSDAWHMPVVFSRDRRHLAIVGQEFRTDVWDLRTGEKVLSSAGLRWPGNYHSNHHPAGFFLDDRRFLAPEEKTVQLWDLEKRQPLTPRLDSHTKVSSNGRRLIVPLTPTPKEDGEGAGATQFGVRDMETGKELFQIALDFSPWLKGDHRYNLDPQLSISFPAGGEHVMFGSAEGKRAAFDLSTGKPVPAPMPAETPKEEYRWSPMKTGHLLVRKDDRSGISSGDEPYWIIDRLTNRQVFPPADWGATRMRLSEDQTTAFVYRPWEESPERAALLLGSGSPLGLAANLRVAGLSGAWQAWDWRAGKPLGPPLRIDPPGRAGSAFPITEFVVRGIRDGRPWPAWTNHLLFEKSGSTLRLHDMRTGKLVSEVAFSPEGGDQIWDPQLNADGSALLVIQVKRVERTPSNFDLAFTLHVLTMPSLERIGEPIPVSKSNAAWFTREGGYLIVHLKPDIGPERLHLYQVVTPAKQLRSVMPLAGNHYEPYTSSQLSRTSFNEAHTLLANVQNDGTVHVYRLPEGKLVQSIKPKGGPRSTPDVTSVAWRDGETRLVVLQKESVEIWDMTALQVPPVPPAPSFGRLDVASWVSLDGRRRRIATFADYEFGQPEKLLVVETDGANPGRILCRLEPGLQGNPDGSWAYRFSGDGETLLGLGSVVGGDVRAGCLRAWNATTGHRLDFPESPAPGPVRYLAASNSVAQGVAVRDGKAFLSWQAGRVVGPFPVPDDVAEVVGGEGPGAVSYYRVYLRRPNGRVTVLWLNEPGRSLDLPAEVTGVRSVQPVTLPPSLAVTRPDAQTVRRWRVGTGHELADKLRLDAPIIYADARITVGTDGAMDFRGFGSPGKVPGGPFRAAHVVSSRPPVVLLLGAEGKCTLVEGPTPVVDGARPKAKLTTVPLSGSVGEPILQAAFLAGKKGRLPERLLAVRTASAAYLWDRDNPANPPTRIAPERTCKQVAFCTPSTQGAFVLTEDEAGVALWEVGASDKPFLTVEGPFAQVAVSGGTVALRRPDGQVLLRTLSSSIPTNRWQAKEVAWNAAATGLIIRPTASPTEERLFATTADGSVGIFDLRAGKPDAAVIPHGGTVERVETFTSPARWLTCGADGTVRLWSREGAEFRPVGDTHQFGKRIVRVESRPGSGRALVVPDGGTPRLIDLTDGKKVRDFPVEEGAAAWLAANGLVVVIGNRDGSLQTWPVAADRSTPKTPEAGPLQYLVSGEIPGEDHTTEDLLLSVQDTKARIYSSSGLPLGPEVELGSRIKQSMIVQPSFGPVQPDPFLALAGEDGSFSLFQAFLGRGVGEPVRPEGGVVSIHPQIYNPPLKFLVVGAKEVLSVDDSGKPTRLFTLDKPVTAVTQLGPLGQTGVPCLLLQSGKEVRPVRFVFLPGGNQPEPTLGAPWTHEEEVTRGWRDQIYNSSPDKAVVTLAGKKLRCWNAAKDEPLGPAITSDEEVLFAITTVSNNNPKEPMHLWAITPTGHSLWNVTTGARVGPAVTFPFGAIKEVRGPFESGRPLLLVGKDGTLWQWAVNLNQLLPTPKMLYPPHRLTGEGYQSVEVVPPGNRLLTRASSGTLQSWDIAGDTIRPGKLQLTDVSAPPALFGTFQPQSWGISGGGLVVVRAGAMERWDLAIGERVWQSSLEQGERKVPYQKGQTGVLVLPGEQRLLTMPQFNPSQMPSRGGESVRLWDAATGKPLTPVLDGTQPRITPDGKHLLLGKWFGESRTVRAYRLDTGEEVPGFEFPGDPWRSWEFRNSPDWRYYSVPVEELPSGGGSKQTVGYRIHDGKSNKVLTPVLKGTDVSFSTDGRYVRVGGQVYELPSGSLIGPEIPELWIKPRANSWEENTLRGAVPGWTWSPRGLQEDGALLDAVTLAVGRQIDEGGEVVSLSSEDLAQVRRKVAGNTPVGRWRRERRVDDLKQVLAAAEKAAKWNLVMELLDRLEELGPSTPDLKARRIQARASQATELAQRQSYLLAAMQFRTLFREAPEQEKGNYRYDAACCAARAGTGQGIGAPWRAEEFPEWRKQAHEWLRAELESVRANFEKTPSMFVARQMAHWQRDEDFHALRAPELLARLPAEEVEQWKKLWADVAKLSEKAGHVPAGAWKIDGKEVVQESAAGEALLLFGDAKWSDYDFEVEAMPTGGVGEVNAVVRAAGVNDFTLGIVGGWNNTAYGIYRVTGGQFQGEPTAPGSTKPNQWLRIRMEVRGKTGRLFVDGKKVAEPAGIPGAAGGVGLHTFGTAARFRNLKVTDPQGKVLFEGVPPVPGMIGEK